MISDEEACLQANASHEADMGLHCNVTWDSIYCWPATPPGQRVTLPCPAMHVDHHTDGTDEENEDDDEDHSGLSSALQKDVFAYRICEEDGRWRWGAWTNYSLCLNLIEKKEREGMVIVEILRYILFSGSIVSLLCLLATLFVFCYFKSLRCDRLRVHTNLVLSLVFRFSVILIQVGSYFMDKAYSYRQVDWLCRLMLAAHMYGVLAVTMWMFVEGLFLYSRITTDIFGSGGAPFKLYYTLGWGLPLLLISVWSFVMHWQHKTYCWHRFSELPVIWIIKAPMAIALVSNLVFLVNIIRVVVIKFRSNPNAESVQFKRAVRATVLLFPLLGIANMFFLVNPKDASSFQDVYVISFAVYSSTQGISVSILYCFLSKDVRDAMRRQFRKLRARRDNTLLAQRRSARSGTWSRTTATTHCNSLKLVRPKTQSTHLTNEEEDEEDYDDPVTQVHVFRPQNCFV